MVQTYKVLIEINNNNPYHLRTYYVPTTVKNQSLSGKRAVTFQ